MRRSGELDPRTFLSVTAGLGRRDGSARLHVFSLADFRKAAGGKWGKLEGLVAVASSQIIRRNIDPAHDLFTRLDTDLACVVMPGQDRQAAHAKVTNIARELTAHLFGAGLVSGHRPQVVTANMAVADVLADDGRPSVDAITTALTRVGPALHPEAALGPAHRVILAALPPAEAALMALTGGTRRTATEPQWLEMHRPPAAEMEVMQAEIHRLGGEPGVLRMEPRAKAPERVMRAERRDHSWLDAQIAAKTLAAATDDGHMGAETVLTLAWTPTWVTGARAIGAYHARVIREDGEAAMPLEGGAAYAKASPIEILTLDRFVATQAAAELKALAYGRSRTGLIVPVHWMSLAPRWREFIRLPFEACPPQALRRLLKIEVFGLAPGMPPQILRSLVEPLEKLGCDVLARLPLGAAGMVDDLKGVRGIGADLAQLAEEERTGDDPLLERLIGFRDTARRAGIASYVWSVRRRPLIAHVARASFSLINGPGIMCDVSRPVPLAPRRL